MICPVCHSDIANGCSICPACHADLSTTRVMPKLEGEYCSSCGALVPTGSKTCPHCGVAAPQKPTKRSFGVEVTGARASTTQSSHSSTNQANSRLSSLPSPDDESRDSADSTCALPRFESAIPAEPAPNTDENYGHSGLQRTRIFGVAALASIVIVGGAALLVTHPWNPLQNYQRAITAADVSTAGYPGEVEQLSGQDKSSTTLEAVSADEQIYTHLIDAYTQLGQFSKLADELEAELDEYGTSGSDEDRAQAAQSAQQLSIDISNLITTISGIDASTTGTYEQDKNNIETLASWLRNRIEAIEEAWSRSAQSTDPASDTDSILAPMLGNRTSDGSEAYVNLFANNYVSWMPQEK